MKEIPVCKGQERWNLITCDIVLPPTPRIIQEPIVRSEERRPNIAYINSENLDIIKKRIDFPRSDEELIEKLVVFQGWKTEIKIGPIKEKNKYSVKLNLGVIAQEIPATDEWEVSDGYKFYQLLGVYSEYNGNPKVNKNKSIRDYATIQRSNCPHPEPFHVGENFFAKPEDAIEVKRSKFERTGYSWKK